MGAELVLAVAKVMDTLSDRSWRRLIARLDSSLEFREFVSNYYADDLVLWKKTITIDR